MDPMDAVIMDTMDAVIMDTMDAVSMDTMDAVIMDTMDAVSMDAMKNAGDTGWMNGWRGGWAKLSRVRLSHKTHKNIPTRPRTHPPARLFPLPGPHGRRELGAARLHASKVRMGRRSRALYGT
eukprot:363784-Chlamydomonas_euryale.AAC.12